MKIEFNDVFTKEHRFLFECSECFALVVPGRHDLHADWHNEEKRKNYVFER